MSLTNSEQFPIKSESENALKGIGTRSSNQSKNQATASQSWLVLPKICTTLDLNGRSAIQWWREGAIIGYSATAPLLLLIALQEWLPERFP